MQALLVQVALIGVLGTPLVAEPSAPEAPPLAVERATPRANSAVRALPPPKSEVESTTNWAVPVLHTTGLFLVMRTTEAVLWPTPFADTRPGFWLENYEAAFTQPPLFDTSQRAFEWDHDRWTINVIGHGLLGSELFYRPRRCGGSVVESLLFAAAASATWEYVFEANGVRPSALDLTYTPLAGMVLGEARYAAWQAAGSIRHPSWRGIVRAVFDPLGELSRALGSPC